METKMSEHCPKCEIDATGVGCAEHADVPKQIVSICEHCGVQGDSHEEWCKVNRKIEVQAWTDGGCPVPGGVMAFAYLAKVNGVEKARRVVSATNGTNNRAELSAVVMLLEDLKKASRVTIHTDSKNVIGWVYGWNTVTNRPDPAKRFKTGNPEVKAIVGAIERVTAERGHEVSFVWVKGPADSEENEIVDAMCTEAIKAHNEEDKRENARLCQEFLDEVEQEQRWERESVERCPECHTAAPYHWSGCSLIK
jgi:ribonuclease HI